MARRALTTTAAAFASATALLLTGCGGNDKSPSDDVERAASLSDAPDVSVPSDFHLVFDFDMPSDPKQASALSSAENYIRALKHGIAQQDPNDPAYQYYSLNQAAQYAQSQIEAWKKGGYTVYGTDKYFDDVTTLGGGQGVLVTFCRNQAKSFSKVIKTGKVLYNEENLASYQKYKLRMVPPSGSAKAWKAFTIEVAGKSKECQR